MREAPRGGAGIEITTMLMSMGTLTKPLVEGLVLKSWRVYRADSQPEKPLVEGLVLKS